MNFKPARLYENEWESLAINFSLCNLRFKSKELLKVFMMKNNNIYSMWLMLCEQLCSETEILEFYRGQFLCKEKRFQAISFSQSSSNVCFIINGNTFAKTRGRTKAKFCSRHMNMWKFWSLHNAFCLTSCF